MKTARQPLKPPAAPAVGPRTDWAVPAFVWGVWALSLGALAWFVAGHSNNVPWSDDIYHVSVMVGEDPNFSGWLTAPYNNHFLPMTKLVLYLLGKATAYDFRAGMYLTVFTLGALAAVMIQVARKVRGSVAFTDAVFPLALVNLGHMENLLQNWGALVYILLVALMGVALLVVVRAGNRLTLPGAVTLGVCLVLLPLNGSPGLVFIPGLVLWLAWWGVRWWRAGTPPARRDALVVGALVLAAVLTVPLSFYHLAGQELPPRPDLATILANASRVLCQMFGSAAPGLWPVTGVLAVAVLVTGAGYLLAQARRQPGEWPRSLGILAVLAGFVLIALAVGAGRPSEECFAMRFALFVVPALCGLYYVGVIFPRPALGRLLQTGLFCGTCLFFYGDVKRGSDFGNWIHQSLDAFENDLRVGVPADILAERYTEKLILMGDRGDRPGAQEERAAWVFRLLRDKGVGVFRDLKDLPAFWEAAVPVQPAALHDVTWDKGVGVGTSSACGLTFSLGGPRKVYGIRLKCTLNPDVKAPLWEQFTVTWRRTDLEGTPEQEQQLPLDMKPFWDEANGARRQQTLTVWVDGTIDQFRLRPDTKPFVIQITDIVLLVPPQSEETGRAAE